jgi:GDP-D-mannose dehydratase
VLCYTVRILPPGLGWLAVPHCERVAGPRERVCGEGSGFEFSVLRLCVPLQQRSTVANQQRALITGISGQDGSYLSELLLEKGYEVHGVVRRVAIEDPQHRLSRIQHLLGRIHLHAASLESYPSLMKVLAAVQPDEVYHLAAQSYVSYSFEDGFSTFEVNINGTHYLLSSCRDIAPKARFYFAGTSEMFGSAPAPQNELTAFRPRSAYGISKVAGYHLTRNYREAYGLHASCATGETHSVREFLECAFGLLGLDPYRHLVLDERFIRPAEVDLLLGDASKARQRLGWSSRTPFRELVLDMVSSDLDLYSRIKGDPMLAPTPVLSTAAATHRTVQPTTGK